MTLTQITYFNAVCEYKNVTKEANALFVSRTAVSRALKDLENEWGLVLFKRSRTGVELTEDGKKVKEIRQWLFPVLQPAAADTQSGIR